MVTPVARSASSDPSPRKGDCERSIDEVNRLHDVVERGHRAHEPVDETRNDNGNKPYGNERSKMPVEKRPSRAIHRCGGLGHELIVPTCRNGGEKIAGEQLSGDCRISLSSLLERLAKIAPVTSTVPAILSQVTAVQAEIAPVRSQLAVIVMSAIEA
jgi:hypothetical protein